MTEEIRKKNTIGYTTVVGELKEKMSELTKLKKGILEAIDFASSQNKAIQQIVDRQYKLLKNLALQLQIIQKLEREYLKQKE